MFNYIIANDSWWIKKDIFSKSLNNHMWNIYTFNNFYVLIKEKFTFISKYEDFAKL